jgi:hypothetical protein
MKPMTPKQQRTLRAALISQLGWAPEPGVASERYCAGVGELTQSVTEKFGRDVADNCVAIAMAAPKRKP